eukprot:1037315-Amphidinium_carterae.1
MEGLHIVMNWLCGVTVMHKRTDAQRHTKTQRHTSAYTHCNIKGNLVSWLVQELGSDRETVASELTTCSQIRAPCDHELVVKLIDEEGH